jgi:hypothetical protein
MSGKVHHQGLANVTVSNEVTQAELSGVVVELLEVMPGMFSIHLPDDQTPADASTITVSYGDQVRTGTIEYQRGGNLTSR